MDTEERKDGQEAEVHYGAQDEGDEPQVHPEGQDESQEPQVHHGTQYEDEEPEVHYGTQDKSQEVDVHYGVQEAGMQYGALDEPASEVLQSGVETVNVEPNEGLTLPMDEKSESETSNDIQGSASPIEQSNTDDMADNVHDDRSSSPQADSDENENGENNLNLSLEMGTIVHDAGSVDLGILQEGEGHIVPPIEIPTDINEDVENDSLNDADISSLDEINKEEHHHQTFDDSLEETESESQSDSTCKSVKHVADVEHKHDDYDDENTELSKDENEDFDDRKSDENGDNKGDEISDEDGNFGSVSDNEQNLSNNLDDSYMELPKTADKPGLNDTGELLHGYKDEESVVSDIFTDVSVVLALKELEQACNESVREPPKVSKYDMLRSPHTRPKHCKNYETFHYHTYPQQNMAPYSQTIPRHYSNAPQGQEYRRSLPGYQIPNIHVTGVHIGSNSQFQYPYQRTSVPIGYYLDEDEVKVSI